MKRLLCKNFHKNTIINSNDNFKFIVNHSSEPIKILSNTFSWQTKQGKCKTSSPMPSVHNKCKCKTKIQK